MGVYKTLFDISKLNVIWEYCYYDYFIIVRDKFDNLNSIFGPMALQNIAAYMHVRCKV